MRRECRERFPRHWLQRKPLVSDPGMHHGTCVTHVPWYMSGSLTRGRWENVPGIPGACATHKFTYLVRGPWKRFPRYCRYWPISLAKQKDHQLYTLLSQIAIKIATAMPSVTIIVWSHFVSRRLYCSCTPKKYALGMCVIVVWYEFILPIFFKVISLVLESSYDFPMPAKQPWMVWANNESTKHWQ